MSIATLYNIGTTLRPGPNLFIQKSSDGTWSGRLKFTCQKFALATTAVQNSLAKGTPLTTLYPESGDFGFLLLEDWDSEDQPGGYTEVTINFKGSNLDDPWDTDDKKNVTYTRTNALKEESIFKLKKYIDETGSVGRSAIKSIYDGSAYLSGSVVLRSTNREVLGTLNSNELEWHKLIVLEGHDKFLLPTSEWTKTSSGKGKIPSGIINRMGKKETPEGNPAPPKDQSWILSGATEELQVTGDGVNSYSLTWTSGIYPDRIYVP